MAAPVPVQLVISGDTSDLSSKIAAIHTQMKSLGGGGAGGAGMFGAGTQSADSFQQSLRGLIGRFSALWAVMKSGEGVANIFAVGIKFNSAMQDARLGIGALITAQATLSTGSGKALGGQEALNAAMAMGDDQIQKLRISGLSTAATTEQLVSAYQDAVGGGLRAGMSLDQIRKLTVQTVQAAGAMGVPMNQLNQEIRSILDGTIDRNSRVAIRLGITNADVAKWKDAGTLFQELNKRMDAFSVAGKESMKNWTTLLSNMNEANQILMGEAFKAPMKGIQDALQGVMNTVINTDTAQLSEKILPVLTMFKDLGSVLGDFAVGAIEAITNALMGMGQWWETNRASLTGVIVAFKVFMADAFTFIGAVAKTLIKTLADGFLWFTKLPEPIKAGSIALGVFTAAVYAMNTSLASGVATKLGKLAVSMVEFVRVAGVVGWGTKLASVFTALGGPVTAVAATVVAVGAGIYYMATAGERAAKAMLELKKQTLEQFQESNKLLPVLKATDEAFKQKSATADESKQMMKDREFGMQSLIKLYPAEATYIKEQTALGRKLADVWLDIAKNKLASLKADLAAMELENSKKPLTSTLSGKPQTDIRAVKFGTSIEQFSQVQNGVSSESLDFRTQTVELIRKQIEEQEKVISKLESETILQAKILPDAKKIAELARLRAQMAQAELLLEDSRIDAMDKTTSEGKQAWENAKANLETERKIEQIHKMKLDTLTKNRLIGALIQEGGKRTAEIDSKYAEDRENAAERFYEFIGRQEGNASDRRIAAISQEFDKRAAVAGLVFTAEEKANMLRERSERERTQQIEADIRKLESALGDLEKVKGRAFTFEEQRVEIAKLAIKLKIGADAVKGLNDKLGEMNKRKQDWRGGIMAGLSELSDRFKNKFDIMKSAVQDLASGMQSAFSTAIKGMINGTMNLSQGIKSLWAGILDTIINVIADIVAKYIVWGIAGTALTALQVTESGLKTSAYLQEGAAGAWAAYGWIPFYGAGLALAQIALMVSSVYAAGSSGGASKQFAGGSIAEGGEDTGAMKVTSAGGSTGSSMKETKFPRWMENIGVGATKISGAGFPGMGAGSPQYAPVGMGGNTTVHYHQNAPIWDTTQRGIRGIGRVIVDGARAVTRERGVVIRSKDVFGGI